MKQFAPAAERNREPIVTQLQRFLVGTGTLLEIGSGTGQHASYFASALPGWRWQPSDRTTEAFASIQSWREEAVGADIAAPLQIDVLETDWGVDEVDAIYACNVVHIAPWEVCEGLFRGARYLREGGFFFMYGPFQVGGKHTAPSNEVFEDWLKSQDPAWGVRHFEELCTLAEKNGMCLLEKVPMPANNFFLVFQRRAPSS